jgi:hypothetical protein
MLETQLSDRYEHRSVRHCHCLAHIPLELPQVGKALLGRISELKHS